MRRRAATLGLLTALLLLILALRPGAWPPASEPRAIASKAQVFASTSMVLRTTQHGYVRNFKSVCPTPEPETRIDPELGVPIGKPLLSAAIDAKLTMDGTVEKVWDLAPILSVPLHYGLHGEEQAGVLELRSLHDADNVYFLARWPAESHGGEPRVWRNLLTIHWRLVDMGQVSGESTGSTGLACTVGCHTATADGQGRLSGIRPETIPPGPSENLPAGGGWSDGEWLIEWSRPKASDSPYDQSLIDPHQSYRFFVKLFLGLADQADPVSDVHELRLIP